MFAKALRAPLSWILRGLSPCEPPPAPLPSPRLITLRHFVTVFVRSLESGRRYRILSNQLGCHNLVFHTRTPLQAGESVKVELLLHIDTVVEILGRVDYCHESERGGYTGAVTLEPDEATEKSLLVYLKHLADRR